MKKPFVLQKSATSLFSNFRSFLIFGIAVLSFTVIGCKKDGPDCKGCLTEEPQVVVSPGSQGDNLGDTLKPSSEIPDPIGFNPDARQKYVGNFRVNYTYYSYYMPMSMIPVTRYDTIDLTVKVSYLPGDSVLMNVGNWIYKKAPALTFKIDGYTPTPLPGNSPLEHLLNAFPLTNPAIFNGGELTDPSPFCYGGFTHPDTIIYEYREPSGSRNRVIKKVKGYRIP